MLPLSAYQTQLLRAFSAKDVRYMVIGAKGMQAHGIDRETHDLDLLVEPTIANAARLDPILAARIRFPPGHTAADLTLPNKRITIARRLGMASITEVDALTSIDGIDYAAAAGRAVLIPTRGLMVPVAALADLLAMKELASKSGNDAKAQARDLWDMDLIRDRMGTNQ